jgi:hypothetical protein
LGPRLNEIARLDAGLTLWESLSTLMGRRVTEHGDPPLRVGRFSVMAVRENLELTIG